MSDDFDAWNDFRRGETTESKPLYCCECGGKAEGNVSCPDGSICDSCHDKLLGPERKPATMNKTPKYPEPTEPEPSESQLEEWVYDSVCDATDGCRVEPDGICPHGHPSWLLRLELV